MMIETFFENFDLLTDAPNAVVKLRELILRLAVKGKLVPQNQNDEPASILLARIRDEIVQSLGGLSKKLELLEPISKEDIPFDLPQGWIWVRFPELGQFGRGKSKYRPRNDPKLYEDGKYPLVQTGDVARSKGVIKTYTGLYNDIGLAQSRLWSKGTLCITIAANIADSGILDFDACIPDSIVGFVPSKEIEGTRYFDYFMRTAKENLQEYAPSTAQKNINLAILEKLLIPLPPLAEQKRIVEKCDRLLSICDEIEKRQQQRQESIVRMNESAIAQLLSSQNPEDFRQHWQRICNNFDLLYSVPETIPKLRQAILQLAVQGKLVGQDQNDEPASVLLEKIKLEKELLVKEKKIRNSQILPAIEIDEVTFKLPVGWEWTRLDDICSKITDGVHKTPKYTDYGIPFLSVTQLKNGMLEFNNTKYISPEDHQIFYQRCNPEKGDILICKVGGTIGVTAVVEVDIEFSIFVQLALIKQIIVNPYYLKLVLLSDEVQNYIKENSVGSAMPYISLEKLKYIQVPLPPLAEQKRIVEKCDRLMSLCDTLEAKLKQGRDSSEKLMEVAAKQLLTA